MPATASDAAKSVKHLKDTIEGCKRRDPLSQETLYREFYPALYTLCKTFFSDKHDILTALNNGMLRVFAHIDQFDEDKGSFYGWLHTVVRNAALTLIRDRKTGFRSEELTDELIYTQSENPLDNLKWEELFQQLEKLPTDTRAIVVLFYVEDLSIKEIGKELLMKEGTVKWHLSEGRRKLRLIFKPKPHTIER